MRTFFPFEFFSTKMYSNVQIFFKVFSKIIKISFCKCPIFYLEFIRHMQQPALSSHQKHSDDACFSVWLHFFEERFSKEKIIFSNLKQNGKPGIWTRARNQGYWRQTPCSGSRRNRVWAVEKSGAHRFQKHYCRKCFIFLLPYF